jgi:hypothetical protein
MQPPKVTRELDAAIEEVAKQRGLRIARDTHYDASNVEVSWWRENQLHRIDFQPYPEGHVVVTYLIDSYPFVGRVLYYAWRTLPMFPYVGQREHKHLGQLDPPFGSRDLRAEVTEYVARAA